MSEKKWREFWINANPDNRGWSEGKPDQELIDMNPYGAVHVIEKAAYDECNSDLRHHVKIMFEWRDRAQAWQAQAEKLAERLGMVDAVGMPEPYDRQVREALTAFEKFKHKLKAKEINSTLRTYDGTVDRREWSEK